MSKKKTAPKSDDTPSKQDKAKDAVKPVPSIKTKIVIANVCVNIFPNSKSYLTLFDNTGPFVPGVTITGNVTSDNGGVWKPKRCNGGDVNHLHLRLTCKTPPTPLNKLVPATGNLTIVLSIAPSPAPVPVVYVDDDPATP